MDYFHSCYHNFRPRKRLLFLPKYEANHVFIISIRTLFWLNFSTCCVFSVWLANAKQIFGSTFVHTSSLKSKSFKFVVSSHVVLSSTGTLSLAALWWAICDNTMKQKEITWIGCKGCEKERVLAVVFWDSAIQISNFFHEWKRVGSSGWQRNKSKTELHK